MGGTECTGAIAWDDPVGNYRGQTQPPRLMSALPRLLFLPAPT
jgi:hypothetical protein